MLTLRPLELLVHWAFRGHSAHISLGKWTTPPGTKDISCLAGHRMVCRSQSRLKACARSAFTLTNRPSFAIDLQVMRALTHQVAAQIGPLSLYIFADRLGDTRFRDICWRDSHCADETRVKTRGAHGACIYPPSRSDFCAHGASRNLPAFLRRSLAPLDETHLSLFVALHILFLNLFGNRQDRIGHSFVF